jgi:hypothetical protein
MDVSDYGGFEFWDEGGLPFGKTVMESEAFFL